MNWLRKLIARTCCATPWNRPKYPNKLMNPKRRFIPNGNDVVVVPQSVLSAWDSFNGRMAEVEAIGKRLEETGKRMLGDDTANILPHPNWQEIQQQAKAIARAQIKHSECESLRQQFRESYSRLEERLHTENAQLRAHLNWKG